MTQTQRILKRLKETGSITPMEAMKEYGCMRLAAVIFILKSEGWPIVTEFEQGQNRYGDKTRWARYVMETEGRQAV